MFLFNNDNAARDVTEHGCSCAHSTASGKKFENLTRANVAGAVAEPRCSSLSEGPKYLRLPQFFDAFPLVERLALECWKAPRLFDLEFERL